MTKAIMLLYITLASVEIKLSHQVHFWKLTGVTNLNTVLGKFLFHSKIFVFLIFFLFYVFVYFFMNSLLWLNFACVFILSLLECLIFKLKCYSFTSIWIRFKKRSPQHKHRNAMKGWHYSLGILKKGQGHLVSFFDKVTRLVDVGRE